MLEKEAEHPTKHALCLSDLECSVNKLLVKYVHRRADLITSSQLHQDTVSLP